MPRSKLILICQSGGEFRLNDDSSLSYIGGEAHALDVTKDTSFDEFKSLVADICDFEVSSLSIKYFLPSNKRTLITISREKDLTRMIDFYTDFVTAEVYITGIKKLNPSESVEFYDDANASIGTHIVAFRSAVTPVKVTPMIQSCDESPEGVLSRCNVEEKNDASTSIFTDKTIESWNREDDGSIVDVYVEEQFDPSILTSSSDCSLKEWKDIISGVGQDFSGASEFRDALQKYSIARRFGYKYKKNDSNRASVVCATEGCPWKIHASWVPTEQVMRIKKMNDYHTCGGESWKSAHPSKSWLVSIIKERLKQNPNSKPKDIANAIHKDYGIELNYTQVWRGLEHARTQLQGSHKGSYSYIPWFCEKLIEANPGSFANFFVDYESKFIQLFMSFRASIDGFHKGCRPLIFLDSTSLRSKYNETLFTATALDGNNGFFPVAYGIVDVENDENWVWFLQQLRCAVSTSCLTFVSDKDKGLSKLVSDVFPGSFHGYSIYHLTDSFMFNLKGPFNGDGKGTLLWLLLSAAHASHHQRFTYYITEMKRVSLHAYQWVTESEPERWVNSLFMGERFDHVTVDVAEVYSEWMEEAKEKPIVQKLVTLMCKTIDLMNTRRNEATEWTSILTPLNETKILEHIEKAKTLKVLFSSNTIFEVHDDSVHVVDMVNNACSCLEWKVNGLPCRHAAAVVTSVGKNVYDCCSAYFTSESYRATYSGYIFPVSVSPEDFSVTGNVFPPANSRRNHHKAKRHKAGEFRRTVTCTRCGKIGHNKVTCKEPMP